MTRAEYDAICARDAAGSSSPDGAETMLVCVQDGRIIHPDEMGPERAEAFKQRCQAIADAAGDRRKLLAWIAADFEIEWPETKETP